MVTEEGRTSNAAMREEYSTPVRFFSQRPYAPGDARRVMGFYMSRWTRPTTTLAEWQVLVEIPYRFIAVLTIALPAKQVAARARREICLPLPRAGMSGRTDYPKQVMPHGFCGLRHAGTIVHCIQG